MFVWTKLHFCIFETNLYFYYPFFYLEKVGNFALLQCGVMLLALLIQGRLENFVQESADHNSILSIAVYTWKWPWWQAVRILGLNVCLPREGTRQGGVETLLNRSLIRHHKICNSVLWRKGWKLITLQEMLLGTVHWYIIYYNVIHVKLYHFIWLHNI